MASYIEPLVRAYGYAVKAIEDWNVLVNNLRNHQSRIVALETAGPNQVIVDPTNVPIGGIILWSGSVASIPTHFVLCNGANGTPDLRDRFVIGAGGTRSPGATGGASTHTHTVGESGSGGSHSHSVSGTTGGPSATVSRLDGVMGAGSATHTHSFSATSGSAGSHSHSNPSTGSGSNLPPFFALAYIMRIT